MQNTKRKYNVLTLILAVLLCITAVLPFISFRSANAETTDSTPEMTFENGLFMKFETGVMFDSNTAIFMAQCDLSALNEKLNVDPTTHVQFTSVILSNKSILANESQYGHAIPQCDDNDNFTGYHYHPVGAGQSFDKTDKLSRYGVCFIYLPLSEDVDYDATFDISIKFVWYGGILPNGISESDFTATIKNASLSKLYALAKETSGNINILEAENIKLKEELSYLNAEYNRILNLNSEQEQDIKLKESLEQSIFEKNAIISAREEQIRKLQEENAKLKSEIEKNVTCSANVNVVGFIPGIVLLACAGAFLGGKRYAEHKKKAQRN